MMFPCPSTPTPDRQTWIALPSVAPHSGPSLRLGFQLPVVHDQRQVLTREDDVGADARAAVPGLDVVAAVGVAHERRLPRLHRGIGVPELRPPAARVGELEAAVECREQVRAQRAGHLHLTAGGHFHGRLQAARIERDLRPGRVDPRHSRHQPRVFARVAAERAHQHRRVRATLPRPRPVPEALTRERWVCERPDPVWQRDRPRPLFGPERSGADSHPRQRP